MKPPTTGGEGVLTSTLVVRVLEDAVPEKKSESGELVLAGISVAAASLGLFFAWLLYFKKRDLPDRITARFKAFISRSFTNITSTKVTDC